MPNPIHFGPFRIPPAVNVLFRGDDVVPLEPLAVRVLRYLAEREGTVVSKQELLEQVWPDAFTTEAVLKKSVSLVRRALEDDPGEPRFIETHHRRGYRFIARVSSEARREPERPIPDFNPFVGRENEIAALEAEYRATLDRAGRLVVITGEAGIGKTQLARRFQAWTAAEGAQGLYARFFDYQGSRLAPYETFLDLLGVALEIDRGQETAAQSLRARASERWGVSLPDELFAAPSEPSPIGLGDGRFRVVVPVADCFVRLSRERPLVLLLDDLQWADETAQDVIGYLMRTAQAERIFLLGTCRSEELESAGHPVHQWLERQASYRTFTTIGLKPLSESVCRRAIGAVFGGAPDVLSLTPEEMRAIHRGTGGNPYFLMEVLRLLLVEGGITADPEHSGRWLCTGLRDLRLPETLVMAARAKLRRLPPETRELLELAAVVGDEFHTDMLAAMRGRPAESLALPLAEARAAGALSTQTVSPGEDFRFHHSILREVLYADIDPPKRRLLHAAAARALETVHAAATDRVAVAIGIHYEAACDRPGALLWGRRAWQAARDRRQWREALDAIERADRAAFDGPPSARPPLSETDQRELRLALAEALAATGQLKRAEAMVDEVAAENGDAGGERTRAAAWLLRAEVRAGLSRYAEATADAERAAETYRRLGDAFEWARAVLRAGAVQVALGRYEEGARCAGEVLNTAGDELAAHAAALMGWARAIQGRFGEGAPLLERAAAFHERTGDVRLRARVLRHLHWLQLSRGRYEEAIALAAQARDDCRRADDRSGEAKCAMGIGQARIAQGLYDEGLEVLGRVREALAGIGDAHCEAETRWLQARAELGRGRLDAAEALLAWALAAVKRIGDRDDEFRMLTDMARLRLRQGADAAALAAAEEAVGIAEELENRDGLGLALVEHARALLRLSRTEIAQASIERARDLLEATGSGEAWLAYWVHGHVMEAAGGDARASLRRAVERLEDIRNQLAPDDGARRAALTSARGGPAADLRRLALDAGETAEADAVARSWNLPMRHFLPQP
jgi:DNA-binding winged helix-turn-helix (wHTH) protein/tetratricopeptide (TPR) repeat protein